MASTFRIRAKLLARVVAPVLFATALSACSSVPDWVDPTTWVGGDSQAPSDQTSDAGTAADQTAAAGQESASAQGEAAGQTPDIAAIPPKPAPPSTADEQKQVSDSLAADRAQAHYSADALRGGTEAAAAPPPAEGASPQASPATATTGAPPPSGQAAPDRTADMGSAAPPPAPDSAEPSGSTADAGSAGAAATPALATSSAAPPPNQMAKADTPSSAAPAAAPMVPATGAPPPQSGSDMQASFAPSNAPALDPSVSQYVPQQILSHYRETAASAAVPAGDTGAPARHHRKKIKTSQKLIRLHFASRESARHKALIEANRMANRESVSLRTASAESSYSLDPSLFAPVSKTALAVVNFSKETTILDRKARSRIQTAAQNFSAQGGNGFVRVVGRASGPANNMPLAVRLRNNFERSEAQATAVARELIRDGVPAQRVLVEAVGDRAIDGQGWATPSRSAEIFLQS